MGSKTKGFSLLEVLVAAFILFLVLATVTITYTGSVKSTISATESIKLNNYAPMLIEHISLLIKDGEREGEGFFFDTSYTWKLELVESKPLAAFYDVDNFQDRSLDKTVFLWEVVLISKYDGRSQTHLFNAVSWEK